MSIELPEAAILADQLNKELSGKRIESYDLRDYERLQSIGMLDEDTESFGQLVDGVVESAVSRGNVIRVTLHNGMNLVLGPEYGGKVFYHKSKETATEEFHLRLGFDDGSVLTVRLTSMGLISALPDDELHRSYVYRRDFLSDKASLLDEDFTFERFSELLGSHKRMLKSVLVGKNAIVVGLSNSAFQDVIYRARLHPKRKAAELDEEERRALFNSIKLVLHERMRLKGKREFIDIYGDQGEYTPAMGPNMKDRSCPRCGADIEKLSVGGGQVYLCPDCQG
jgi:formamidopyrimidine-DNA glycosylase